MAEEKKNEEYYEGETLPRAELDRMRGASEGEQSFPSPNHKVRSRWFRARTAWPAREAPVQVLNQERARVQKAMPQAPIHTQWESVGPANIGGRMTSIVCHPDDPDRIWAGAAGGGVWTSSDAGRSWRSLWHTEMTLNVGSLAIDPHNPDILYCGTGEANMSADSYAGVGLYRSTNAGESWLLLAPASSANIPKRIGTIAIDPTNPQHIRIGGIGFNRPGDPGLGGMYVSRDSGVTWTREESISPGNYWCHSIVFDPTNPNIMYATVTAQGSPSGIWRSQDGGSTWEHVSQGLPHPAQIGRTTLAIAPSNPRVVYALASHSGSIISGVLGLFRTGDGGDTWRDVQGRGFRNERQMGYNNTIAVHPRSENHVICGGVDLHLTRNGGRNWRKVTDWRAERGDSDYAHADHHALLMPAAAPDRVYDMNDGGMDVSEDGGRTWSNRSNGLAVTMFYDVDVAQSFGDEFGGGAQDNGTIVTTNDTADDFFEISGGDGGFLAIDPTHGAHAFTSSQGMTLYRFRPGSRPVVIPPPAPEAGSMWMVYIAMDPSDPKRVFTGTQRVWRTEDDGDTWQAVSPFFNSGDITAIEIAPADTNKIYAGTENGGIFRSLDGGDSWSADLQGPLLPGFMITRVESKPDDADVIVVTIANFGHSHVFLSEDGGETWRDIDRGQLPDVPHHSVAIPANAPETIYVANDSGVYVSPDLGATWQNLTGNLPNVMVVDLVHHLANNTLTAATYGRSLWRIDLG